MTVEGLKNYINAKIDEINKSFPGSISEDQKESYIKSINPSMTQDEINEKIKEIDQFCVKMLEQLKIRYELDSELQRRKEELNGINKTFGEVYKSYIIHVLKYMKMLFMMLE